MAEKNYISGILIKEVGQYGQLNISIKVEDFIGNLKKVENNGWCNLTIAKNRNPTDKGYTHHCFENTWKAEGRKQGTAKEDEEMDREADKKAKDEPDYTDESQELPF